MKTPTGHAITPIPVTEAIRIPLPEEIAQVQLVAHQLEQTARDLCDLLNWDAISQLKDKLLNGGKIFYQNLKKWLINIGYDLKNPIELLVGLKQIGARNIESSVKKFAELESVDGFEQIIVPTDPWIEQQRLQKDVVSNIRRSSSLKLSNKKAIVIATDVHEYGKDLVKAVLLHHGVKIIDVGVVSDPKTLVEIIETENPQLLTISTYNGVALSYSQKLLDLINRELPIFMGGKLNQHLGGELAQDVTNQLKDLGIITCSDIYEFSRKLIQALS